MEYASLLTVEEAKNIFDISARYTLYPLAGATLDTVLKS